MLMFRKVMEWSIQYTVTEVGKRGYDKDSVWHIP
jgi:hypothetical protein